MTFQWTEEKEQELVRLRKVGYSAALIAEALGTNRNSVLGKVFRLRLPLIRTPRKTVRRQARPKATYTRRPLPPRQRLEQPKTSPPPLEAPPSKRLTLHELHAGMCKFIADEGPPWTYCGHDAELESPWCTYHRSIVYTSGTQKDVDRIANRTLGGRLHSSKTFIAE